ncbi:MAG TPA: antitoxin [Actinomycetales bacterium]|nr:antitoxin [Actinomycetales bacterium]
MRTTINVDERLLSAAKARARQEGITLGEFVDESLRRHLSYAEQPRHGPEIPVFERGTGPLPGVDLSSAAGLLDLLDEE